MANIFNKWFGKKDEKVEQQNIEELKQEMVEENQQNIEQVEEIPQDEDVVEENKKIEDAVTENEPTEVIESVKENILEDSIINFAPGITEEESIAETTIKEPVDEQKEELEFVEKPQNFFNRLKEGLTKTREGIKEKVDTVLAGFRKIDEELFEELEEMLIMSDIGVQTTQVIIENIKNKVRLKNITNPEEIKELLKEEINNILKDDHNDLNLNTTPSVIIVVGVNGVGKTTSIGKIANNLIANRKKVVIGAADTFRAAATEQLEIWAKRVGADIIKHQEGADPGAVVYDAIQAAKARKADVLICDTAGRLHNKKNLMDELGKVQRIIDRELPDSSKEMLLVLDATTGQNAVQQARLFNETVKLSGIILTKLDGTAKGGIIITIKSELNIPVKFIGVGEGINDLQMFDSQDFVRALFD